jgi:two-component system LytT family response regulator
VSGGGGGALRVLVVDDEAPARAVLREYLERVPGVSVAAECANGFEALKAADAQRPDVAFLDVEMPKLNGFEVRELLDPAILPVFVTAYDEWAVKAFEVHAVDYVMKPFAPERIAAAVERARERLRARDLPSAEAFAAAAAGARPNGRPLERVVVRDGAKVHVIPAARLSSARAQDDYVEIRSEGKSYLKSQTLASLASSLDPARFVRVHRSHLVNVDFLTRLEGYAKTGFTAVLSDGMRVPVSREGHARLKRALGDEETD